MKPLTLLAGLVPPCLAITDVQASQLLYMYSVYDLDVEVWGQGNGYVAPGCEGVVASDKRCTLNEFVNYVTAGRSATTPSYYDLDPSFTFVIGDSAAVTDALRDAATYIDDRAQEVVHGRTTVVGLFEDLAQIVDKDYQRAQAKNIGIARHWTNLKEATKGLTVHLRAAQEAGVVQRLKNFNRDVVWEIVRKESEYRKSPWLKVDWTATVEANPDLLYPKSELYRNTVEAIKGNELDRGSLQDRSIAAKVANQFRDCFGG